MVKAYLKRRVFLVPGRESENFTYPLRIELPPFSGFCGIYQSM